MSQISRPWPWKQIQYDEVTAAVYEPEPEYALAKEKIDQDFGREKLVQSWIKTCTELEKLSKEVQLKKEAIFPILQMEDVEQNRITPEMMEEIRRVGSVIVKNTIPSAEAQEVFAQLQEHIARNKGKVTGFPTEQPVIYNIYSSPSQNRLRSHPELLRVMRWINNLWNYPDNDCDTSPEPLIYADRVRIRSPGAKFLGLGPHVDSGGLCRWTEPAYRNVYSEVFEGRPDELNCYDMGKRKDADQGFYKTELQSTVLRSFQGWTALTETSAQQGTIILYPNVQLVMAYVLLRPFFRQPEDETKIMDPREWTYDASGSWFPGATKKGALDLSPASHPHLRLEDTFLHVPPLSAGDTVWWHSDVSLL